MFTQIYIKALLVDEDLADQVWEAWDAEEIDNQVAWIAWLICPSSNKWNRRSAFLKERFAHQLHIMRRVVDSAKEVAPFLWTVKPDSISGSKPVV